MTAPVEALESRAFTPETAVFGADALETITAKRREAANRAAVELARQLEAERRSPTLEERGVLLAYSGIGGTTQIPDATALANPIELADLMLRWHPLVAAYLALMPNPIGVFLRHPRFTETMLSIQGRHAQAHGLRLPTQYALEVVLRAFGFDRIGRGEHEFKPFRQAPLNQRMIAQRDALETHNDPEPYWRPVISAAQLAYALVKADEHPQSLHRQIARQLRREYGFVPTSKGDYAEVERRQLERSLEQLLEGQVTVLGFDRQLHE
jgi:hypothetical protein